MSYVLRHLPDILSDLAPDIRHPAVFAALCIVVLIAGLSLFAVAASSPARAAEAAVRDRLDRADLALDRSRIHYDPPAPWSGYRRRLVCGRVTDGPAFAAVVEERRRQTLLSLAGAGANRVEALAIQGDSNIALLAACRRS